MKNFNELSVTSSSYKESNLQLVEQKACIVVGIANPRIKIRVEVLLSESPEYQTIYICVYYTHLPLPTILHV